MDDFPPAAGSAFLRDLHAAQEAMRAGTTQDSCQQRLYKQWSNFCTTLKINPTLQDSSVLHAEVLQVYGHRVRHAEYSKRRVDQLGKESVSQAWGAIAVTHLRLASQTPGSPPTPKPTKDWTCGSPGSLKPTGSKTI